MKVYTEEEIRFSSKNTVYNLPKILIRYIYLIIVAVDVKVLSYIIIYVPFNFWLSAMSGSVTGTTYVYGQIVHLLNESN